MTYVLKGSKYGNNLTNNMKKASKQKDDPAAKDITCAVRFNSSMYARLKDTARDMNLSLSDVIRQALVDYMESHSKSLLEKKLEEIELRKKVTEATANEDQSLRDTLLELLNKAS